MRSLGRIVSIVCTRRLDFGRFEAALYGRCGVLGPFDVNLRSILSCEHRCLSPLACSSSGFGAGLSCCIDNGRHASIRRRTYSHRGLQFFCRGSDRSVNSRRLITTGRRGTGILVASSDCTLRSSTASSCSFPSFNCSSLICFGAVTGTDCSPSAALSVVLSSLETMFFSWCGSLSNRILRGMWEIGKRNPNCRNGSSKLGEAAADCFFASAVDCVACSSVRAAKRWCNLPKEICCLFLCSLTGIRVAVESKDLLG